MMNIVAIRVLLKEVIILVQRDLSTTFLKKSLEIKAIYSTTF